jgi:hypothetical protein
MRPAPRADSAHPDWLLKAVAIVDRWERTHQRRLLETTDAARLAEFIARELESAYDRGQEITGN